MLAACAAGCLILDATLCSRNLRGFAEGREAGKRSASFYLRRVFIPGLCSKVGTLCWTQHVAMPELVDLGRPVLELKDSSLMSNLSVC